MADIDAKGIREALLAKGVALNPPVTNDALAKLTSWAGGSLHADVLRLLREFDGFNNDDFEVQSFVSVWPVGKALSDDWTRPPTLGFSDWSLNAIIFGFDPSLGGPVISIEDNRAIAPAYNDFWSLLLSDRLF